MYIKTMYVCMYSWETIGTASHDFKERCNVTAVAAVADDDDDGS